MPKEQLSKQVNQEELLENIDNKISNIDYLEAKNKYNEIYDSINLLNRLDASFRFFYEEIRFEGLKFFEPDYVEKNNYSHLGSNGYIITKTNEMGPYPSNIDIRNRHVLDLVAVKFFIELKKSKKIYEYGNIGSYAERLKIDLKNIYEEQKRFEKESLEKEAELRKIYKEKIEKNRAVIHREVPKAFIEFGIPLNEKISNMLMEPDEMQEGRMGSGYTNVFRELSTYVNLPTKNPLDLFDQNKITTILDTNKDEIKLSREEIIIKLKIKEKLEKISTKLTHSSHIILLKMIHDITFGSEKNLQEIKLMPEKFEKEKIGTCTTAELYFFDWKGIENLKYKRGTYEGLMKIITNENDKPLMIEKSTGEQSCLSLVPLKIGNVEIPIGSLLQAIPKNDMRTKKIDSGFYSGKSELSDYEGFKFLRISTLSLPPEKREESFGNHYHQQYENGFINYDWLETKHYLELIENI